MYKKILIPTDGSKASYNAAKHAIWAANSCGSEIIVLNVVELNKIPEIRVDEVKNNLKKMMMEEGNIALDKVSQLLDESTEDIKSSFIIKEGNPADKILQTIDDNDIDLVVMGTSGKHGLDRIMIGSVAEKVVRNANCTITVTN
jgi:nucleotide-binding universal stress UspA family protein